MPSAVIRDLAATGLTSSRPASATWHTQCLGLAPGHDVKFESITGYKQAAGNVLRPMRALLRGRYLAGIAARRTSQDRRGRAACRLPHPRGAAGHQRLHAGHSAPVNPEGAGEGGVGSTSGSDPPQEARAAPWRRSIGTRGCCASTPVHGGNGGGRSAATGTWPTTPTCAVGAGRADRGGHAPVGRLHTARVRSRRTTTWKSGQRLGREAQESMIRAELLAAKCRRYNRRCWRARRTSLREHSRPQAAQAAVRDNEGTRVIARGGTLGDAQILGMNWRSRAARGKSRADPVAGGFYRTGDPAPV